MWFEADELVSDFLSDGRDLADTLDHLSAGVFVFCGEEWRVRWMDEDASREFRLRQEIEEFLP
ncbi:hypothetical protein ACFFKU_04770 [Kineococcus gynurae]|uniref:Uncharacterized protein n=1 Tax=Kineococcus gynurae TaxID=452979 RepID=A0ABV5LNE4_9ACTN